MKRRAVISGCGCYRYQLERSWDRTLPTVLFVGLNPSIADAIQDDPTVRRCIGFARSWGFGAVIIANLFGFRSTNPSAREIEIDPVGPRNDWWLKKLSANATMTVAAWGTRGTLHNRATLVLPHLKNVHTLGQTHGGQPRHPLYLSRLLVPIKLSSGPTCA